MFQFPRFPPVFAGTQVPLGGLPHSETSGSQAASASPEQFRRVAASFFGRRRQGIHHAPSLAVMLLISSVPSRRTGTRSNALRRLAVRSPLRPEDAFSIPSSPCRRARSREDMAGDSNHFPWHL